jgi:transposase
VHVSGLRGGQGDVKRVAALQGLLGPHQRRLLAAQLRHIHFLDTEIATLSAEVAERMRPFGVSVALVDTVPGTDESAGKRRSGATGRGNHWLRSALVEAAHAAARTKRTYLAAQYKRIAARRGSRRAAVAVAHEDLGATWFDRRDRSGCR